VARQELADVVLAEPVEHRLQAGDGIAEQVLVAHHADLVRMLAGELHAGTDAAGPPSGGLLVGLGAEGRVTIEQATSRPSRTQWMNFMSG